MTIFFVTHDLEEAVFVGSRLLVLSHYYTDHRDRSAMGVSRPPAVLAKARQGTRTSRRLIRA